MHEPASARSRRPRPVADAPRPDAATVAKAWLLELMAAAPLEAVAAVRAADLAREGPVLCGALLAALRDDDALERLRPGGELGALAARAGHLAGANSPARAAAAIEALRAAAWAELWAELRAPAPALVADLAMRLAYACGLIAQAVLSAEGRPGVVVPSFEGHAATGHERAAESPPAAVAEPAPEPEPRAPSGAGAAAEPRPAGDARVSHDGMFVVTDARATAAEPWLDAIARRLERHETDHLPFAVLAVEIDDIDRIAASERGSAVATAVQAVERAICDALHPADMLVRERLGRYWLTAPDTDQAGAGALGERIAAATAATPPLHGAPLTISVGLACCPHDGEDAESLASWADEGVFAARSAGLPLA